MHNDYRKTSSLVHKKPIQKKNEFRQYKAGLLENLSSSEVVLLQDESSFYMSGIPHKVWAMKGSHPELPIHGGRKRLNVIGAIDPCNDQGYFQFIDRLDAQCFLSFLKGILNQFNQLFPRCCR